MTTRALSQLVNKTLLVAALLIIPAIGRAAGVTVITHGFQAPLTAPAWVTSMANAITNRLWATHKDVSLYEMDVPLLGAINFYKLAGPNPASSVNCEIVVILNWAPIAGLTLPKSTYAVAHSVAQLLMMPNAADGLNAPLAELPMHLIGHSRGGSLVCAIAEQLGEQGIWVDQVTTLDPHPLIIDAPVNVYDNVVFADNYWRSDALSEWYDPGDQNPLIPDFDDIPPFNPDGNAINNAFNESLNGIVTATQFSGTTFQEHWLVHAYYYGTINLTGNDDGDSPAAPVLGTWYQGNRASTGYAYSRVAQSSPRPRNGLAYWFLGTGTAYGTPVAQHVSAQWPNVALQNVDDVWTYVTGQTGSIRIAYIHDDSDNPYTVTLFTDDDRVRRDR